MYTPNITVLFDMSLPEIPYIQGLARAITVRCTYGVLGRKVTKVIYDVYMRFWPTFKCALCSSPTHALYVKESLMRVAFKRQSCTNHSHVREEFIPAHTIWQEHNPFSHRWLP